jgi:hypothetical protein
MNKENEFPDPIGSEVESLTQELLLDQREHADRYIAIADTKAAFLIGLLSAVILALYQSSVGKHLLFPVREWGFSQVLFVIALMALAASVLLAIFVVRPRLFNTAKLGLIPWLGVSCFPDRAEYVKRLGAATRAELMEELAGNVYDLSKIARKKYYWLGWSFRMTMLGLIASVLACLLRF